MCCNFRIEERGVLGEWREEVNLRGSNRGRCRGEMIQMNAVIDGGRLFSAKMAEARGDKVGSGELVIAGVVRMRERELTGGGERETKSLNSRGKKKYGK